MGFKDSFSRIWPINLVRVPDEKVSCKCTHLMDGNHLEVQVTVNTYPEVKEARVFRPGDEDYTPLWASQEYNVHMDVQTGDIRVERERVAGGRVMDTGLEDMGVLCMMGYTAVERPVVKSYAKLRAGLKFGRADVRREALEYVKDEIRAGNIVLPLKEIRDFEREGTVLRLLGGPTPLQQMVDELVEEDHFYNCL